jgi:hypothetical protein
MDRRIIQFVLALGALLGWAFPLQAETGYPPLRNGDLIFQTSTSAQSAAIRAATAHPFTHMGIIRIEGDDVFVIEAAAEVEETLLADWVNRGDSGQVAIYRDPGLSDEEATQILSAAAEYYGRPYDLFFSFDNEAIYCSELPFLAYREAGITIGRVQTLSELNFDNPLVRKLIEARWERHEACSAEKLDFEGCFALVLDQKMVTPASIAEDARFQRIFSDFPE